MASTKPKPAVQLGSVYAAPTPITREPQPPPARAGAPANNGSTPTVTGRDVEIVARSVVAAIERLTERRAALAATVAEARAAQIPDAMIHGYLVVSGLPQDDIDAAMA